MLRIERLHKEQSNQCYQNSHLDEAGLAAIQGLYPNCIPGVWVMHGGLNDRRARGLLIAQPCKSQSTEPSFGQLECRCCLFFGGLVLTGGVVTA